MDQVAFSMFSREELKALFLEVIQEHEQLKKRQELEQATFSFNQASKILRISNSKLNQLVRDQIIKPTSDGRRIPGTSITNYLQSS